MQSALDASDWALQWLFADPLILAAQYSSHSPDTARCDRCGVYWRWIMRHKSDFFASSINRRGLRHATLRAVAACAALILVPALSMAAPPADYLGVPFDDAAYRADQAAAALRPRLPYHAFETAATVWDSKDPKGAGWAGKEESGATIGLDSPDADGKRFIHYHVALNGYRYAVFGWNWAGPNDAPVDLSQYDAVAFLIRITGPRPPQELFFAVDETESGPVSLRDYESEFRDGNWHRITIPVRAMRRNAAQAGPQVRGFAFRTFVWDSAEYDVQLEGFTLERATDRAALDAAYPPAPKRAPARGQAIPGRLQCAFYDRGGEGISYHDTTAVNILSGVLNQKPMHQRRHATDYEWSFRRDEGVDISFTKDFADLKHKNFFDIGPNQLYIGGAEPAEWCSYTVDVKKAGIYKVIFAYANDKNGQRVGLSINRGPVNEYKMPLVTGGAHTWNKSEIGTITFPQAGRQLFTLHYGNGFNLGYFDFDPVTAK